MFDEGESTLGIDIVKGSNAIHENAAPLKMTRLQKTWRKILRILKLWSLSKILKTSDTKKKLIYHADVHTWICLYVFMSIWVYKYMCMWVWPEVYEGMSVGAELGPRSCRPLAWCILHTCVPRFCLRVPIQAYLLHFRVWVPLFQILLCVPNLHSWT